MSLKSERTGDVVPLVGCWHPGDGERNVLALGQLGVGNEMGAGLVLLLADNRDELREPELRRRGRTLGGELSDKALGVEEKGTRRP